MIEQNIQKLLLVGNPNTGKTTFFNSLTKSNEHVGNWHGVTVDSKSKIFKIENQKFELVDLPGIYSLEPISYEEKVATDFIESNKNSWIINLVDAETLSKNLYLTIRLLEEKLNVILVLNNTKKNKKITDKINIKKLQEILKINVFILDAENSKEIKNLKQKLYKIISQKNIENLQKNSQENNTEKIKINSNNINNFNSIKTGKYLQTNTNQKSENYKKVAKNSQISRKKHIKSAIFSFFNIFKLKKENNLQHKTNNQNLIENNEENLNKFQNTNKNNLPNNSNINEDIFLHNIDENLLEKNITERHKKIQQIVESVQVKNTHAFGKSFLDKILLNKFLCFPIFALILMLIFYLTFFALGSFLSGLLRDFIQNFIGGNLLTLVKTITSNVIIIDFFDKALIAGVGSLVSFLPQVVLLFFFMGILEESGYLARIAFMFDDLLSKVGLSGKSVYTLLMGFGCSTTATITCRNMEDKNSKIKTAMLTPYMSCSAKLPIYVILGSVFFGASNVFVIFCLYLLGIVLALLLSVFWEKTYLKSKAQSFILEFSSYRAPTIKRLLKIIWENTKQFLVRIGGVLISVNIIIWLLSSFNFKLEFVSLYGGVSILQAIGTFLAPVFVPLGFGNWGATSALIAGIVAKEVIISSLAMFNGISSYNQDLNSQLALSLAGGGVVCFTPASAISFLVFCLLYVPCISTISVLRAEIGKKWTIISILIEFAVAYLTALIVYNSFKFAQVCGVWVLIILALLILFCIVSIYKIFNYKLKNCSYRCKNCNRCKSHNSK